jgi:hypothetical protein
LLVVIIISAAYVYWQANLFEFPMI